MIEHRIKPLVNLLPYRMSREIKELYLSTTIINFGQGMVQIFEPIYLFAIGYSLQWIVIFYLMVYIIYFLLMPLGARFACRFGTEKSMVLSTIFIVVLYISLFSIQYYAASFYLSAIFYSLQKIFYWPAYHADFARHMITSESAREVSSINLTIALMYVIGPITAGALIAFGGFGLLFTVVSIIFLLSNLPLLSTKEKFIKHSFSYRESFQTLIQGIKQRKLLSYFGYSEELTLLVVWPIFISVIIKDNLDIGLIIGLSFLVSVIVSLIAGRYIDTHNKRHVLKLGTVVYSLFWFLRLLIKNAAGVFTVNSLSWIAKNVVSISLMAVTYGRAHVGRVMSAVVAFESTLVLGKIAMMIMLLAIFHFSDSLGLGFDLSFVLSGLTSLLYFLL